MARRRAAKRTLIDPKRGGKRYVRRRAGGTFKESDQVSRAAASDGRTRAKSRSTKGQGDRGDR
jgi:hypothetical protein